MLFRMTCLHDGRAQRRSWAVCSLAAIVAAAVMLPVALHADAANASTGGARWPSGMDRCAGANAVMAASDDAAQSDIYSAATLAGVIGSRCVVDAGARGAPMPAASKALLAVAAPNVYVVGGVAAVPDAKLHGRQVHRIGGADRWETARLVGELATDLAAGRSPDFTVIDADTVEAVSGYSAITARWNFACAIRTNGELACSLLGGDGIAGRDYGQASPPAGDFSAISAGTRSACAIRTNGELACWGYSWPGQASELKGTYQDVDLGDHLWCAIRTDGQLACWERGISGLESPPKGTYTAVAAAIVDACAIRTDGQLACWGSGWSDQASPPAGTYAAIDAFDHHWCAIHTDGRLACWGTTGREWSPLAGTYIAVSTARSHSCAIRTDGQLACWGDDSRGQASPPAGIYVDIVAAGSFSCAINTDGDLACWGLRDVDDVPLPSDILR
ncbi:MAG: hypothetical protein F4190_04785 [Acidimicrobiales bacterium]|nr:hypothetical protein [Acidimicrobiales bacterium]MYG87832.1 hypothetical protein [Acidimicrobiales bacterium]MYI27358.1 hypothetical protein [Acidimicrobiales bacterium]